MKTILIDFEDSFTYNIASELHLVGLECEVIHWRKFCEIFESIEIERQTKMIILGPGPGHPDEYQVLVPIIQKILSDQKIFLLGICLGHQLIWQAMGIKAEVSAYPVHGQAVDFRVPIWFDFFPTSLHQHLIKVQRYNSLFVPFDQTITKKISAKTVVEDGQVMASRFANCLSLQFHPESVGTSYRRFFFSGFKNLSV